MAGEQNFNADDAKDYAQKNPEQAEAVIDKAADAIDKATGGKYSGAIDKGSEMLQDALGIPDEKAQPADTQAPAEPTEPQAPTEPGTAEPETPAPTEPEVPAEPGAPAEPQVPTEPSQPIPADGADPG